MSIFALIKNGTVVVETRNLPAQPGNVPAKGLTWLPFVETYPIYDPLTQVLNPTTTTIEAARVFKTATVRALTSQELDDRKTFKIGAMAEIAFEIAYDMENRMRVIEAKSPVTKLQYKTALKARLS